MPSVHVSILFLCINNTCNITSVLINNSSKILTVTDLCLPLGLFIADVYQCILDLLESVKFSFKFISLVLISLSLEFVKRFFSWQYGMNNFSVQMTK